MQLVKKWIKQKLYKIHDLVGTENLGPEGPRPHLEPCSIIFKQSLKTKAVVHLPKSQLGQVLAY
jgi:hypothetical protein